MEPNVSAIHTEGSPAILDPIAREVIPVALQQEVLTRPHVFLISEILLNVFGCLSKRDIASSMRVCRSWTGVGADVLWRNLESLLPLMKVLAPMTRKLYSHGWSFVGTSSLQEANWERLEYYASRVRCLDNTDGLIAEDAYQVVHSALQSRSQRLLPKLRDVKLTVRRNVSPGERKLSTAFISSALKCLRLTTIGSVSRPITLQNILQDLGVQNIFLTKFEFSLSGHVDWGPVFFNDSETLQLLGLQELSFYPHGLSPQPNPKHFFGEQPNLRKFAFGFMFPSGTHFPFFESLVDMAPQLEILECHLTCDGSPGLQQRLDFSSFRPLLQLSRLSRLSVNQVVELNIEDIRDMGRSWRALTSVCFRPDLPQGSHPSDPPVSDLLAIAEYFPPTFHSLEIKLRWEDNMPQIGDGERLVSSKIDTLVIDTEHPIIKEQFLALANLFTCVTTPNAKVQMSGMGHDMEKLLAPLTSMPRWDQAATEKMELAVRSARRLSKG